MRYDPGQKGRTRERVLAEAARTLRAQGPEKLGVAEVMRAAGLTHGGFYAHFRSKDELLDQAIATALDEFAAIASRAEDGAPPEEALRRLIGFYLSPGHRDEPACGCPLPSLAAHVAHLGEEARIRYGRGLAAMTARIARRLEALGVARPTETAGSVAAELIGAITLARATADRAQSDAILAHSRIAILARVGLAEDRED